MGRADHERRADLGERRLGPRGPRVCERRGDERRGGGGAAERGERVAGVGRHEVDARGGEVDGLLSVVGEPGERPGRLRRGDRHHGGAVGARGVGLVLVQVQAVVPGGRHHGDAGVVRARDRGVDRGRVELGVDRAVDDGCVVAHRVGDPGGELFRVALAVVAEHAHDHQPGAGGGAGHAGGLVVARGDEAGDGGAVPVSVVRGRARREDVRAVDVVDVAVAVIVEAVAGNLARVRPEVLLKARMLRGRRRCPRSRRPRRCRRAPGPSRGRSRRRAARRAARRPGRRARARRP